MSIIAKSIYKDTGNFFRNQFIVFFLIAISCALITIVLCNVLLPNTEQIAFLNKINRSISNIRLFELMQNMTQEQQRILIRVSSILTLSRLIGKTFLIGSTLFLIQSISSGYKISISNVISFSISSFPKLFILIFLNTVLVQTGVMFLIIPGVLIAILLSFSHIIVIQEKIGIFTSIHNSARIAWKNIHLTAPAIITWMLLKTSLMLLSSNLIAMDPNIGSLLGNTLSNLITVLMLIYVFRLYMLIRQ